MGEVVTFAQKEPMYCAQDFREYIGYKIIDVISNEIDSDTRLILQNEQSGKRVTIEGLDSVLDGETLFISNR